MNCHTPSPFRLKKRIGGGSFGEIYSALRCTNGEEVAVKVESVKIVPPRLSNEARIYRALSGGVGIPTLKWYGVEADYSMLAMDLLGSSLEGLFVQCDRRFSLKTVLMIADQLISRIEYLHRRGIIHRDIKPENFMTGRNSRASLIYVIDFGLAKRYRDQKTQHHIPYVDGKQLIGTARYTSVNTHLGIEQSRRDDLESIAYLLIYFLKGSLPWMGLKAATRQAKYAAIGDLKVVTAIGELCKGLPNEFGAFLNDVRRLEFQEEPRYSEYRLRFRDLFIREKFVYDSTFDWDVKKPSLGAQVCETLHTAPLRSDVSVQNLTSLSNMPAIEHAKKAPSRQVKRVLAMPSIRAPPSVRAPHRGIH